MEKNRKLVIVGDSAFAEVAYEYFTWDSDYEVVGFSVEKDFLKKNSLFGLPVVPFEAVQQAFHPREHHLFVAVVCTQLNRLRARLCAQSRTKGFCLATYVSRKAVLCRSVQGGEHCSVSEDHVDHA